MSIDGTASYEHAEGLPWHVSRAVSVAKRLGFEYSCRIEQGRLLQLLAQGNEGAVIGESGTGCGVGLSWMLSGVSSETHLFSVEKDVTLATACQELFEDFPNVNVDQGDWMIMLEHGPFDLLVLDGGGSGKGDIPIVVSDVLSVGGTLVIDDFTPVADWPPTHGGERDEARLHWLQHPDLLATEIRLASDLSTIVARRIT
jgi:predicted O-methyltransferase YrrM